MKLSEQLQDPSTNEAQEPNVPNYKISSSILGAGAVIAVCLSLVTGVAMRNRIDMTGRRVSPASMSGLLASNDPKVVSIPLIPYYNQVFELLKEKYVDPIRDDTKLANGAVRGMIVSLDDPESRYFSSKRLPTFLGSQAGQYQGVGVDLGTILTSKRKQMDNGGVSESEFTLNVPEIIVEDVVPGSSAMAAGVQPGDVVYSIDGHWVINPLLIKEFGKALDPKLPASLQIKKAKAEQIKLQTLLDSKPITPNRAMQELTSGATGSLNVIWKRGSLLKSTVLKKSSDDSLQSQVISNGVIRLRFSSGVARFLSNQLSQNPAHLTIDLRDQPNGDYREMVKCLSLLCPSGQYGGLIKRNNSFKPFNVDGTKIQTRLTLLVDSTVKDSAAIFANVLKEAGVADWQGQLSNKRMYVTQFKLLPEGCAYTLTRAQYALKPITNATMSHGVKS